MATVYKANRQKRKTTTIGHSSNTRIRNKHQRRMRKKSYRGQG